MSDRSDLELAAAVAAGDERAATIVVSRFSDRIKSLARQRGIPFDTAQDVVQEVLADVFRQLRAGRFRGDSQLGTWVYRIAAGKIADYWRSPERAVQMVSSDSGRALGGAAEKIAMVRQALSRIPPIDQLILLLHERDGYTLTEIGQRLGLGKSAIGERLILARKRFRDAVVSGGRAGPYLRLKE